jgi:hypothetical protein
VTEIRLQCRNGGSASLRLALTLPEKAGLERSADIIICITLQTCVGGEYIAKVTFESIHYRTKQLNLVRFVLVCLSETG